MNRLLSSLIASALLLPTACTSPDKDASATPPAPTGELPLDSIARMLHGPLVPLVGTGLRFDGVYHWGNEGRHQLLRFYPQGFVVMANGMDTTDGFRDLRKYIDPRSGSKPNLGIHNVPVIHTGDSIFMVTPTGRGNIDYRGRVITPDSISIFKYSHIQGGKGVLGYVFDPDR